MNRKKILIACGIAYALVLFVGLTLWRLPIDNLIPYFVERGSKGRLLLKVERTSFSLPMGCRFEKVSYASVAGDRTTKGRLENLVLTVNLFGLVTGHLPVSFDVRPTAQGGKIQGSAGIPLLGRSAYFEMKLSEVEIEKLGLASFSGRDLKGKASGEMKFKGDLEEPSTLLGEGRLLLKNGSVDTRMDLADLKAVTFDSVRIPFKAKDGRLLLEKGEMEGPMLSGTLSGQITLSKRISDCVLDLTARLRPGPLLEKNPFAGALLSKIKEGGKEIILKIGGTVRQPTMAWSRS